MQSIFKLFSRGGTSDGSEMPIPEERFSELITFAEEREIRPRLTALAVSPNGVALEVAPRLNPMAPFLKERGYSTVSGVGTTREKARYKAPLTSFVLSHWESLPFQRGSCDLVLLRTAFLKGGLNRVLHEMARVLKPNGVGFLSDLHPFSPMVQEAFFKKPVGEEGLGPGFERYDKVFREDHLKINWVKEIFFDGSLKKFFGTGTLQKKFETLRRHPFLIQFSVAKGEG